MEYDYRQKNKLLSFRRNGKHLLKSNYLCLKCKKELLLEMLVFFFQNQLLIIVPFDNTIKCE